MKTLNSNVTRAKRCNDVLFGYGTDNTATGCLTDFLSDARHWCDRHGESFAAIDKRAHEHYLAEIFDAKTGAI